MAEDKKEVFNEFKQKRNDISNLKDTLNSVNDEKEKFYSEKEKISNEIRSLINQIKDIKKKRDNLTKIVKEKKVEKEIIIKDIREKISEFTKYKNEKQDISKKHNLKGDPVRVKKDIEKLELQIETEAISFDKEQKIMKVIKDLKSKFGDFSKINKVLDKMNSISKEIDSQKDKEKALKKDIRKNAKDSQKEHEQMIELSKKVDELKVKEKELFDKFMVQKKEFNELNNKLKNNLSDFGKIKGSVNNIKIKKKKEAQAKKDFTIKEKKEQVNEKIKKGQKLTTEDILIFQK